jgi:uncharacterized membrane protein
MIEGDNAMEIITSTQLTVPTLQLILLLTLSTIAVLIGRLRLALIINYGFTLYWGYVVNFDLFMAPGVDKLTGYTVLYFSIGVVIAMLASIGLVMHHK